MLPQDGGDGRMAGDFQEGDGRVAGGGEVLARVPGAKATTILLERHIPHVKAGVLDPPAVANVLQELCGAEAPRRNAGDPVRGRTPRPAAGCHGAFQLEHLPQAGPLDGQIVRRGHVQRACLQSPPILMPGDSGPSTRLADALGVGGKSLRDRRRRL